MKFHLVTGLLCMLVLAMPVHSIEWRWQGEENLVSGLPSDKVQVNLKPDAICDAPRYLRKGYDFPGLGLNPPGVCTRCSSTGQRGKGFIGKIRVGVDFFSECNGVDCSNYYVSEGVQSPTNTEFCFNKADEPAESHNCDGNGRCESADAVCADNSIRSLIYQCGVCEYISNGACTGEVLGSCSNYPAGTDCGEGMECNADSVCECVSCICRDNDGDGINNCDDNCIDVWNPSQTDSNNNGIGDPCDECSMDDDGDGVNNCDDNCVNEPNPLQGDADGDGIGDMCDGCYTYPDDCPTCITVEASQGGWSLEAAPFAKAQEPYEFYCYDGQCSNPMTQYHSSSNLAEAYDFTMDGRSAIFVYVNSLDNRVSLGMIHDKPQDGDGGHVDFTFSGSGWNMGDIVVSDDGTWNGEGSELTQTGHGSWGWAPCCTDGGMIEIGTLDTSWSITVNPNFIDGINTWVLKTPDDVYQIPSLTDSITISYTPS